MQEVVIGTAVNGEVEEGEMEGVEGKEERADFMIELRVGEEEGVRELGWLCGYCERNRVGRGAEEAVDFETNFRW